MIAFRRLARLNARERGVVAWQRLGFESLRVCHARTFDAGFSLKLMAKDVRTADSLGHALGVPTPLADRCADLWDDAVKSLGDKADHTAIGLHIENIKLKSETNHREQTHEPHA